MEYLSQLKKPGFNYSNMNRNSATFNKSLKDKSTFVKTGTTIVGVQCPEGIVLAADTRATMTLVAEKNCRKIHYIAPNIRCAGAGTAADMQYTTSNFISD
jgi:20S proteasome subunit beta 2